MIAARPVVGLIPRRLEELLAVGEMAPLPLAEVRHRSRSVRVVRFSKSIILRTSASMASTLGAGAGDDVPALYSSPSVSIGSSTVSW